MALSRPLRRGLICDLFLSGVQKTKSVPNLGGAMGCVICGAWGSAPYAMRRRKSDEKKAGGVQILGGGVLCAEQVGAEFVFEAPEKRAAFLVFVVGLAVIFEFFQAFFHQRSKGF